MATVATLSFLDVQVIQYFLLHVCFESTGFPVQKEFKIDFQNGGRGDHPGFPIEMILAKLIYKALRYLLSSFESVGLFLFRRLSSK